MIQIGLVVTARSAQVLTPKKALLPDPPELEPRSPEGRADGPRSAALSLGGALGGESAAGRVEKSPSARPSADGGTHQDGDGTGKRHGGRHVSSSGKASNEQVSDKSALSGQSKGGFRFQIQNSSWSK